MADRAAADPSAIARAASSSRARHLVRRVLWIVAQALRLVPRSQRAAVAFRASRVLAPVIRRVPDMAEALRMHVETEADAAFGIALRVLNRFDIAFDLRFDIEGEDVLSAATQRRAGTLLVGTHALTTQLIPRALTDQGTAFHVVSRGPTYRIAGTPRWIDAIHPNPNVLLSVRSALRRGELILALLDRGAPQAGRTQCVETRLGDVHIADALLRVAVNAGATTLFMMSRMNDDGSVHIRYSAPGAESDSSPEALAHAYARLIIDHNAAIMSPEGVVPLGLEPRIGRL